jgi:hypothetical protein
VHRKLQAVALGAALVTLAACGSDLGSGVPCSDVGAVRGVSLDIDSGYAPKVGAAELKLCWDGACRTADLKLSPSSTSSPLPCSGTGPDAVCGAQAIPTGGKHGLVTVTDLPAKPIDATLSLTDAAGAPLADHTLRITPKAVYPNGPECGAGGPQTGLRVSPEGTVSERS